MAVKLKKKEPLSSRKFGNLKNNNLKNVVRIYLSLHTYIYIYIYKKLITKLSK